MKGTTALFLVALVAYAAAKNAPESEGSVVQISEVIVAEPKQEPVVAAHVEEVEVVVSEEAETSPEEIEEVILGPNGCPVNPEIHWLIPNRRDCRRFSQCVWGRKVPKRCPARLHFNPIKQVCDWPSDAGCIRRP